MNPIKIATAHFENRSGDKAYNLSVIDSLAMKASQQGASAVAFHECSISGYTFARHLSKKQMIDLSERIPEGPCIDKLIGIAKKHNIAVLAGLFEKDAHDNIYKAYVCVDK